MSHSLTSVYRGMGRDALDAAYNNALAVENSSALMHEFETRSEVTRQSPLAKLDLRYGNAPRNRIDYFAATQPGPLLVFVHGGYWQMRSKESFSFLAKAFLPHGIHVAMVGYTLAPEATLKEIVLEVQSAVDWLAIHAASWGADTSKMVVSGWSAGGHLTALCMDHPGVSGGLAISGIYDLEPIRLSYLNDKLRLTQEDVAQLSPQSLPFSSKPIIVAYGQNELPELQRQSAEFHQARESQGLPGSLLALPQLNHFTILSDLAREQGAMAMSVKRLLTL